MIAINKTEKEEIRKRFPSANIVRTMKQKSKRHHYYCEETRPVAQFLAHLREYGNAKEYDRKGVANAGRATRKRK